MNDDCNNNKNTIDHLKEIYEIPKVLSSGDTCSDLYLPGWPPCEESSINWSWLEVSEPIEMPEPPELGKKYTIQVQLETDQFEEVKEFIEECKGSFFASLGNNSTRIGSNATGELDEENATLTITWELKNETNE